MTRVTATTQQNGRKYTTIWNGYSLTELVDLYCDWVAAEGRWTR